MLQNDFVALVGDVDPDLFLAGIDKAVDDSPFDISRREALISYLDEQGEHPDCDLGMLADTLLDWFLTRALFTNRVLAKCA